MMRGVFCVCTCVFSYVLQPPLNQFKPVHVSVAKPKSVIVKALAL